MTFIEFPAKRRCAVRVNQDRKYLASVPVRYELERSPEFIQWLGYRGIHCIHQGRYSLAEKIFRRVVCLYSHDSKAHYHLAVALEKQNKFPEAVEAFSMAVAIDSMFAAAWAGFGRVSLAMGYYEKSLTAFRSSLSLMPRGEEYRLVGRMFQAAGRYAEAAAIYEDWCVCDPDNEYARHMYAAASGTATPLRTSDASIITTFDAYAGTYDRFLEFLDYRAPELLATAAKTVLGPPAADMTVVDAGCGTGLCGPYFRPYAGNLVGIDLCRNMLDKADRRNCYDSLHEGELTGFLAGQTGRFDVLVAADTFCYFGELTGVSAAVAAAVRSGGFAFFTVEKGSEGSAAGFSLQPSGRYHHPARYVKEVFTQADFKIVAMKDVILRQEGGKPVHGLLVTARRE